MAETKANPSGNLLDGMEEIFHKGKTDISGDLAKARAEKSMPTPARKATPALTEKPVDASWKPVKPEPRWMDKLKACAKWAVTFGGLCLLLFYWQQAGLMAESVAVPSMCVCTALAGWGVGKNATR